MFFYLKLSLLCLIVWTANLNCAREQTEIFGDNIQEINWKKIPRKEKELAELKFLKEISIEMKSKKVPNSLLMACALYKTEGGTFYDKSTNNPFNIECCQKKCPPNHCKNIAGKKIKNFNCVSDAIRTQEMILLKSYAGKAENVTIFLQNFMVSTKFVGENQYDIEKLCCYIKTYNLLRMDTKWWP